MARRSRRAKREDNSPSLTLSVASAPRPFGVRTLSPSQTILQEIEDRRTYHPLDENRPARFMTGGPSRISVKDRSYNGRYKYADPFRRSPTVHLNSGTKAPVSFVSPDATPICVRRKERKEVLFAKRKAGRGGKQRRHRRNQYSGVRCK